MPNKYVIYQSQKGECFRRFAREVGVRLAQQQNDDGYAAPAVVDGLAVFLNIVSDLLVKQLNRQSD